MSQALWIPVRPMRKGLGGGRRPGMWICGMATLDNVVDLDQEVLNHTGVIDSLSYLEKHGKVNWNHGSAPGDMLGDIKVARIRETPHGKGLYIEALLNPKVKAAREAYRYLEGGGVLGYSVQGVYLDLQQATKDGVPYKDIKAAFLSQVALTPEPKNWATKAAILKSLRRQSIAKSLTAGAGTDHAGFTGGRALIGETFGTLTPPQLDLLANDFRRRTHGKALDTYGMAKAIQAYGREQRLYPGRTIALAQHIGTRGD
jgi:hypothetical protein